MRDFVTVENISIGSVMSDCPFQEFVVSFCFANIVVDQEKHCF
jgi:hypothetical protein